MNLKATIGEHLTAVPYGRQLSIERTRRGMTLHLLANQCGVSAKIIKAWEDGEAIPDTVACKRLEGIMPNMKRFSELARAERQVRENDRRGRRHRHHPKARNNLPSSSEPAADAPPSSARSFGEIFREVRKAHGLTTKELALMIDVDSSSIGHWERNKHPPTLANYRKLLDLFPEMANVPVPNALKMKMASAPPPLPKPKPTVKPQAAQPIPRAMSARTTAQAPAKEPKPLVDANALSDAAREYAAADAEVKAAEEQTSLLEKEIQDLARKLADEKASVTEAEKRRQVAYDHMQKLMNGE